MAYTSLDGSEQSKIRQIIQEKNIRWLCHFTPRSNLDSIKQFGLQTRDLLTQNTNSENSSAYVATDPNRFDRHSNAICLSISKPNEWMFNKKREQGFDFCLLLINPSVLFQKHCLFYPHNAATASYRYTPIENLQGAAALSGLFSQSISFQKSGKEAQQVFRKSSLCACETTSDQAEIQCLDIIEPQYIDYIIESNIPLSYLAIERYVEAEIQRRKQQIQAKNTRIQREKRERESERKRERERVREQARERERERVQKETEDMLAAVFRQDTPSTDANDAINIPSNKKPHKPKPNSSWSKEEEEARAKRLADKQLKEQAAKNSHKLAKHKQTNQQSDDGIVGIIILIIVVVLIFKFIF